uniref:Uncharacterized protein n=1 Tax=Anguilla anguilla TaxID=7936 RepID=A0A0E9UW58_ANGAN
MWVVVENTPISHLRISS